VVGVVEKGVIKERIRRGELSKNTGKDREEKGKPGEGDENRTRRREGDEGEKSRKSPIDKSAVSFLLGACRVNSSALRLNQRHNVQPQTGELASYPVERGRLRAWVNHISTFEDALMFVERDDSQ
jgi:hypothetical protein